MHMVTMTADQLTNLLSWHERCNAYCASERHAEVMWVASDHQDAITNRDLMNDLAVDLGQTLGVAYDGHEPAPEARFPSDMLVSRVERDERGIATVTEVAGTPEGLKQTPYLVRFRCDLPLDELRRAFGLVRS